MKRDGSISSLVVILSLGLGLLAACDKKSPTEPTTTSPGTTPGTQANVALGGRLYDNWMRTAGVATPSGNSPLWASQGSNTRSGADTWRCKECHGWDYKGRDGAYGSGSHFTGFPGVYAAATTRTAAELIAILNGSANTSHNFSTYLTSDRISALADFLKAGAVVDETQYIDYATKTPRSADATKGGQMYASTCTSCHGDDGRTLNFGSAGTPEYVGTIARDNPWEFIHKIRFGQPGSDMPTGVEMQRSMQDVLDILAHGQTLPRN